MAHDIDPIEGIKASALNYLSRREHSRIELLQKLKAKGYDEVLIEKTLAELTETGLQSDTRFAEMLVRSRRSRGYGENHIRHKLRIKGIDKGLELDIQTFDWNELIKDVYLKKYGEKTAKSPKEIASRMGFLMRRGFTQDQIRDLFRHLSLKNHVDEEN